MNEALISQAGIDSVDEESNQEQLKPYQNEIAIIGIACRFPGANNPEKFWENLVAGKKQYHRNTGESLELAELLWGCPKRSQ